MSDRDSGGTTVLLHTRSCYVAAMQLLALWLQGKGLGTMDKSKREDVSSVRAMNGTKSKLHTGMSFVYLVLDFA